MWPSLKILIKKFKIPTWKAKSSEKQIVQWSRPRKTTAAESKGHSTEKHIYLLNSISCYHVGVRLWQMSEEAVLEKCTVTMVNDLKKMNEKCENLLNRNWLN